MHLIQNKLAVLAVAVVALYCLSTSCAVTDAVLDYPMSFFDEETGETTEVPLGDVIADNADGVGGVVSDVLGGVNPLLAAVGGGAAAALLGGARRKKKAQLVQAEAPAEEPEVKG
tara:strand:- start:813 stop:1157 length:345 start_codon:yes stop_codon:yes gene_type:complete